MAHTARDKKKLLNRAARIRGQVEAIERGLEREDECADILRLLAACRGAINALMAEIMEGQVLYHVLDPKETPSSERTQAAHELIEVINAYLK
jgi:DNA-binding FrmR family transcriptional regulator